LSIAKKLTELQGGMLDVESKYGQGTTFTFSIPFEIPADHQIPAVETICDTIEGADLGGVRILVVEDNDINRLVINRMLKDFNIVADHAANGQEALEKLTINHYDLILLDMEMPVMNGYECIQAIRKIKDARKSKIPVMAMTAHASKDESEKCMQCGVNDYLSKPFNHAELKTKIVSLLHSKTQSVCDEQTTDRLTNLDYLKMLSDDSETFFKEFIQMFLKNTPETITELVKQTELKNWEGVRQAAHKVKPSLNYMGMKDASNLAAEIEKSAKEMTGVNQIPSKVATLCTLCETAYIELNEEINNLN